MKPVFLLLIFTVFSGCREKPEIFDPHLIEAKTERVIISPTNRFFVSFLVSFKNKSNTMVVLFGNSQMSEKYEKVGVTLKYGDITTPIGAPFLSAKNPLLYLPPQKTVKFLFSYGPALANAWEESNYDKNKEQFADFINKSKLSYVYTKNGNRYLKKEEKEKYTVADKDFEIIKNYTGIEYKYISLNEALKMVGMTHHVKRADGTEVFSVPQ